MAFATVQSWSETPASNTEIDGVNIDEGCNPSGINNAIREAMSQIAIWTGADTIASATTTDLSTVNGHYITVSGTTAITGFGTVKEGWLVFLRFSGALTLTHNATSLILPGSANITTAAGDTFAFVSQGSGNWRCLSYQPAAGYPSLAAANTWTATQTFTSAALSGNIVKTTNTGVLLIDGGNTGSNGANIELYGGGHATNPNLAVYDAAEHRFRAQAGGSDWLSMVSGGATFSVPVLVPNGTVSAPSIAFANDTNTGLYSVSADTIGIAAGGGLVGYYNTTGLTATTTTSAATFGSVAAVKNLSTGQIDVTRDNGTAIRASRMNGDGIIVSFHDEATLAGSVQLAAGGVTYNETSDGRFKIDRVPVEVEIDIEAVWAAIEPLAYTKLHGETGEPIEGRQFGLIAQDLYKVFPHAVTPGKGEPGDEDFEQWQIAYSRLVPLIIARQKQFEREVLDRLATLGV